MKQEFISYLLGEGSPAKFAAALVFAFVGCLISLLIDALKRDPTSQATPVQFSWPYLIWDNSKRVILSILLIVVSIRFSQELLGADLTMYLALLIGAAYDRLALFFKNKGLIDNRDKKQNPPAA